MNWFLLYGLIAVSAALIINGLTKPGKFYEYPLLAGMTFLGFAVPQLPAFAADPYLPENAFAKTVAFTTLCAAMCWVGWAAGRRPVRVLQWTFDERRLLIAAAVLSLIGSFFYFKISRLPDEAKFGVITGLPVMYFFFSRLHLYGFVMAALCFAHRRSCLAFAIILFDLVFFIDRIVIAGRRSEAMEFLLAVGLAAWFYRKWSPPRVAVLAIVLVFPLAIASTADYRSVSVSDGDPASFGEVADIDVWNNFMELINYGGFEMKNAMMMIDSVDKNLAFDYGVFHWNTLVFNYVPAQLVGEAFKDSLYISLPWSGEQHDPEYQPQIGSTWTGMADAFASFWYFGALKYFLIAYVLARLYFTAVQGYFLHQFLYILSLTPAMLAITHHTQQVPSAWVHMALLVLPFLLFARVKKPQMKTPLFMRAPAKL